MLQVTFPEVARVLDDIGAVVPAAESHGCLCGALCTVADYSLERWLEEIVPDLAGFKVDPQYEVMKVLYADTVRALRGDEMEFAPLLPDDDATLSIRAQALTQWCQGFLFGFGTGASGEKVELPMNVDEVLRDLTEIGRASVPDLDGSEEEEVAYAELFEYLRAGVQLVHDELVSLRESLHGRPHLNS